MMHQDMVAARTRNAFLWTKILDTPLWALFNILPFIMYKDLHATVLQTTVMVILKPVLSLFSIYWSSLIHRNRQRLLPNIIWGKIFAVLLFFLFPFVDNPWFFVWCSGFYMMFTRGVGPGWMEILKLNIPGISAKRLFALVSSLGYVGAGVLSLGCGWLMDDYSQSWRWIYPFTACLSLCSTIFKKRIPIPMNTQSERHCPAPSSESSLRALLLRPWKQAIDLIKRRSDFGHFQIGFMLGGSGLMVIIPALPMFFQDILQLSYKEIAIAINLCKGLGFALTSPLWAYSLHRANIFAFSSAVTAIGCIYPLLLFAAQLHIACLYLACFVYGTMQAGSEMSWNLSGPIFAKDEDSSPYSTVNVMTQGMRGCIAPFLGSMLVIHSGPSAVLGLASFLLLGASLQMIRSPSRIHSKDLASSPYT